MSKKTTTLAHEFEKAIAAYVADGRAAFRRDRAVQKVYERDAASLRDILKLFQQADHSGAYAAAWKLDTVPREVIPRAIWHILEKSGDKRGGKTPVRRRM